MTIRREDVDAGRVDFSGVATGRRMPPLHPGAILRDEFLSPMGLTAYRLAKEIKVPLTRVAAILAGKRSITAETALRLSRYFGQSESFWLSLQAAHDLDVARARHGKTIKRDIAPRAA
jgi:addiction module HigA family antidote